MEAIKFDRVVSVNSEATNHSAESIISQEISAQKSWKCEKGTEKAILILQLERATVINSIHIGNAHSAFIEVLVGRATDDSNEFQSLVPMSTFMSPSDSKLSTNPNTVRFFKSKDFTQDSVSKAWDRIKVVCSQPFNKNVPYGICFIEVHGDVGKKKEIKLPFLKTQDESKDIAVGSFFAKLKDSKPETTQTASEQIREADKKISKHTPLSKDKIAAKMSEKQSSEKKSSKRKGREKGDKGEITQKDNRKNRDLGLEEISPKRKKDEDNKSRNEKLKEKRKCRKPFARLLDGVVFVISGFKNPLRSDLRAQAIAMGAKYEPDWVDSHCTHLICAFENTPKFNQVQGKGKIVKKDWIEKCYNNRKRYPWRRFALDKTDKDVPESEEEVIADDDIKDQAQPSTSAGSSPKKKEHRRKRPTDDGGGGRKDKPKKEDKEKNVSDSELYNVPTDDEVEEIVDTTDYPMPFLLDVFDNKTFYVDDAVSNREVLERYIIAYHGIITEKLNEDVEYYITEKAGTLLKIFQKKAPNMIAVQPNWIWEVSNEQKLISTTPYLVK